MDVLSVGGRHASDRQSRRIKSEQSQGYHGTEMVVASAALYTHNNRPAENQYKAGEACNLVLSTMLAIRRRRRRRPSHFQNDSVLDHLVNVFSFSYWAAPGLL